MDCLMPALTISKQSQLTRRFRSRDDSNGIQWNDVVYTKVKVFSRQT